MRILAIRLMGLGDVACIGLPAARLLKQRHPGGLVTLLTYAKGGELLELATDLDRVWTLPVEDWPSQWGDLIAPLVKWARRISEAQFDLIYNFDTWFMPCFLARMLKDGGLPVRGNYLRYPARQFAEDVGKGAFPLDVASKPGLYLDSDFPGMRDFAPDWWSKFPSQGSYPAFYLHHCCGLEGTLDLRVPIAKDEAWRSTLGSRRVVGLAAEARSTHRSYRRKAALEALLKERGYAVWSDVGALPFAQALGRLAASDLLVTVSSAPQWFARMVGCPVLILPGFLPPQHLAADAHAPLFLDCQPCLSDGSCPRGIDFACNDQDPSQISDAVDGYFTGRG